MNIDNIDDIDDLEDDTIINISIIQDNENIPVGEKKIIPIFPIGYNDIIINKSIKNIPIINIDIILLEFLINNYKTLLLPIIDSSQINPYNIGIVVNERTNYFNMKTIESKTGDLIINGIHLLYTIKKYKTNYILIKTSYNEIYKNNIFIAFIQNNNLLQNYLFKNKHGTFSFLNNLYKLIHYYENYNYHYLLKKIISDNIKLEYNINLFTMVSKNNKNNLDIIDYLKKLNVLWMGYSEEYENTLINDMFNNGLLKVMIILSIKTSKHDTVVEQVEQYNKNIKNKYYVTKHDILNYITQKQLDKYKNMFLQKVSPLLKELNAIIELPVTENNNTRISMYNKFIKKYNIQESDIAMIYDNDNNRLICPHIRDTLIFNKNDLEKYFIVNMSQLVCKICGAIIRNLGNMAINVKEEMAFYTDVNYNDKNIVWHEIIKVMTYIVTDISITTITKQIISIVYPIIQRHMFNISNIKTIKFIDKIVFLKLIINICIWVVFVLIKKKYPKLIDISIINKNEKEIEEEVLNKILLFQQQTIKQFPYISEEKLKEIFYNTLIEIKPKITTIVLEKKEEDEESIYLQNNPLYDYLMKVIRADNLINIYDKLNYDTKYSATYNSILDFIKFIKIYVYENDALNYLIVEKLNSKKDIIPLSYAYLFHLYQNKAAKYFEYLFSFENLNILYGVTLDKLQIFHAHKWNIIDGTFICSVCKLNYNEVDKNKNIKTIILIQQSIINFYTYYFMLCPEGNIHEFDSKWVCKKCSVNINMILEKDNSYYFKYLKQYEKISLIKKNNILITEYTKYIMPKKIIDDSEYKKNQINTVHSVLQNTKQYITFMSDSHYMNFLKNLGLNNNLSEIVRCNKLNYFIQSILCIVLSFDIKVGEYDYDYNKLKTEYNYNVLQYVLLDVIYKILSNINNKICLEKIIKMIINYEIITKSTKESDYSSQFNIKEEEPTEDFTIKDIYEEIDYTEVDENEVVED